jgi:hypothetical protein
MGRIGIGSIGRGGVGKTGVGAGEGVGVGPTGAPIGGPEIGGGGGEGGPIIGPGPGEGGEGGVGGPPSCWQLPTPDEDGPVLATGVLPAEWRIGQLDTLLRAGRLGPVLSGMNGLATWHLLRLARLGAPGHS